AALAPQLPKEKWEPETLPYAHEVFRAAPLSLAGQSACAARLDDRAWANALIDQWLPAPDGVNQPGSYDLFGLLGTTDDEERFRRFFAYGEPKLKWMGKHAPPRP